MILALTIIILGLYLVAGTMLGRDLKTHWRELWQEPGSALAQGFSVIVIFFLSAFGISDFAISTALYSKLGWVEPRKLPGTLNTQCLLPVLLFAMLYLRRVDIELTTLLPCLAATMLGAWLSPRLTMHLPARRIKQVLACGLYLTGTSILSSKLGWLELGGTDLGLAGGKLALGIFCFFLIGALKALGIGSYPLTMATAYFLGLNPLVCYPLMMGGGALASPLVSIRYIKLDAYSRRLTLLAATVGLTGACVAALIVPTLNLEFLKWIVVLVVYYAATDMLLGLRRERLAAAPAKAG